MEDADLRFGQDKADFIFKRTRVLDEGRDFLRDVRAISWELDTVNSTVTCSTEFFRMLGIQPLVGPVPIEDVWSLVQLEDVEAGRQTLQRAVATHTPLEHFSHYSMPDGRTRVLHTRAIPLADASGQLTRFVGFNHDITEQKRVEDDLRRLSRQLLTLRSEEQRRMARELHETASQTLTALKMTLKQIEDSLPQDDLRARELAKSCRALTSDAIREVRTISSILHPPLMDEAGLTVGLSSYVRLFSERSGVVVNFTIPDDFQRLPKEVELTLFCVAQESLANVHRHSKARRRDFHRSIADAREPYRPRRRPWHGAAFAQRSQEFSTRHRNGRHARARQSTTGPVPDPKFPRQGHHHPGDFAAGRRREVRVKPAALLVRAVSAPAPLARRKQSPANQPIFQGESHD